MTASSMLLPLGFSGSGIELTRAHNLLVYEDTRVDRHVDILVELSSR